MDQTTVLFSATAAAAAAAAPDLHPPLRNHCRDEVYYVALLAIACCNSLEHLCSNCLLYAAIGQQAVNLTKTKSTELVRGKPSTSRNEFYRAHERQHAIMVNTSLLLNTA